MTSGKWEVLNFGDGPMVCSKKPCMPVATMHGSLGEKLKNARLIAAAPELLEAAIRILKHLDDTNSPYKKWDTVIALKAVIAKAEGK